MKTLLTDNVQNHNTINIHISLHFSVNEKAGEENLKPKRNIVFKADNKRPEDGDWNIH